MDKYNSLSKPSKNPVSVEIYKYNYIERMENKIEILFPKEENNIELCDRCLINKYKL